MNNNKYSVTNKIKSREIFIMSLFTLAFVFLGYRLFKIQIIEGSKYKSQAASIQYSETDLTPLRGTIYDCNMKVLAQSSSVWTVILSPHDCNPDQSTLLVDNLSEILEIEKKDIEGKLRKTGSYYQVLKYKVDKPVADKVTEFCEDNNIDGVYLAEDYKRFYPYGDFASSVIGFCSSDNKGLTGLENYYDEELSGEEGRIISAKNGWGLDMGTDYQVLNETKNGYNLRTTIDETIQHYLEKHLKIAAEENKVLEGAVGIVMNVKTGAILGMATYPYYDLNDPYTLVDKALYDSIMSISDDDVRVEQMSNARQKQWRNKAVNDLYEPGSVFKILNASAAIDSGTATLNSTYYCSGSVTIDGETIHCSQTSGHGTETFSQALINSCNPASIKIGQNLGIDRFYSYFYSFGLTEKTGIDLPGEQKSIYYTKDTYTNVSLASASFGQSNKLTAIQMITAISTMANGGNLVTPHIVSALLDENNNVVKDLTPPVKRQVISQETSQIICSILEKNVSEGNGGNAYVMGYRVGGKSGTSQKLDTENEDDYVASFVAIAPCDDPEIAVLVILDTPTGVNGFFGGPLAGKVVGSVLGETLPYLGIEKNYTRTEKARKNIMTPTVVKGTISDAAVTLQRASLNIKIIGNGEKVTSQYPKYGEYIPAGSKVICYTNNEEQKYVTVPNVLGYNSSKAEMALNNYNLNIKSEGANPNNINSVVKSQSPSAGESVLMGTVITLTYEVN